ncbi:MAG: NACHT domain-containing protein [Chloroflexota bacterium]
MPIDPLTATAIAATGKWMWDNYGEMFVDKMAAGVAGKREDRALRKQWQQATTTYLQKLHDEVNNLRVLGKLESQPLEQIYTDVNVLSKLSAERRYRLEELEAAFIPRQRWLREESERRDGLSVATETQRLFILGKPGAGKTTFLKHVALRTIKDNAREDGDKKLPIFVTLKELSDSGQELVPFIAAQFGRADFPEAEAFVRRLLKTGAAVVLLDGLDEVNLEGERRARLITAIKQFVHEFDRCRILLTCRVAATDYSFERFIYVEMADFSPEQQKTFIFRWFQQDMAKRDNCWQALQASRNETLQELAQNPLLLSLLCVTFEERNEFPAERNEIYREATQALLGKWDARRNIQRDLIYQSLSLKHKERLLAQIAAQTFEAKEYFISQRRLVGLIESYLQGVPGIAEPDGAYVLAAMEAQHGLLVERAKHIHSFSHLTLQEYFTTHYIVENEVRGSLPRLMVHVGDDRWREVFLLTAAMLNDATDFAELYLEALAELVAKDEVLVAMLQWGANRSTYLPSGVKPSAARAFSLFLARDRTLVHNHNHMGDMAPDIDRSRSSTFILAYDRFLDPLLSRALNQTLNLTLSTLPLVRIIDLDLAIVHAFTLDVAVKYDLTLIEKLPKTTAGIIGQLQQWQHQFDWPLPAGLASLQLPADEASREEWEAFDQSLEQILLAHWGLEQFWELSEEQADLLAQYLQANLLLLACLELAYVPERQGIVDRLLLPPA